MVPGGEGGGRFWKSKMCSGEEAPDHLFLFLSWVLLTNSEDQVATYIFLLGILCNYLPTALMDVSNPSGPFLFQKEI
jgi:hypothetical protein